MVIETITKLAIDQGMPSVRKHGSIFYTDPDVTPNDDDRGGKDFKYV